MIGQLSAQISHMQRLRHYIIHSIRRLKEYGKKYIMY